MKKLEIDGQYYFCGGCEQLVLFMGRGVTCDCGHANEFTEEEFIELEEAVEEED